MRLIIRPRTICTTSFLFLLLVFRDSVLTGMLKRSGHSEIQEHSLDTHMPHGTFKEHLRMFIDYPSHGIDGRVSRQGWEEKEICHSYRQSFFFHESLLSIIRVSIYVSTIMTGDAKPIINLRCQIEVQVEKKELL